MLKNLEETMIYKLPQLDKCILSETQRQGLDVNDGKIIVRNMVVDQDEWVEPKEFLRSRILDVPIQSLFFALLNYRNTLEKYFYLPSTSEQADAKEQSFSITISNFEFVHLQNVLKKYEMPEPS
jgi:hypothetical protein